MRAEFLKTLNNLTAFKESVMYYFPQLGKEENMSLCQKLAMETIN